MAYKFWRPVPCKRRLRTVPIGTNWHALLNYWEETDPYPGYDPEPYPGEEPTEDSPMPPEYFNPFLEELQKYLGYSYKAGGKTPPYFDCSGYVGWCAKAAGLMPESVVAYTYTLREFCDKVPDGEEAPGDLCFWAKNPGPTEGMGAHVAVYLGDGNIIDDSGGGVKYRKVTTHTIPFLGYWRIPRPYPIEEVET